MDRRRTVGAALNSRCSGRPAYFCRAHPTSPSPTRAQRHHRGALVVVVDRRLARGDTGSQPGRRSCQGPAESRSCRAPAESRRGSIDSSRPSRGRRPPGLDLDDEAHGARRGRRTPMTIGTAERDRRPACGGRRRSASRRRRRPLTVGGGQAAWRQVVHGDHTLPYLIKDQRIAGSARRQARGRGIAAPASRAGARRERLHARRAGAWRRCCQPAGDACRSRPGPSSRRRPPSAAGRSACSTSTGGPPRWCALRGGRYSRADPAGVLQLARAGVRDSARS